MMQSSWPLGVSALDVSAWFHVAETSSWLKIVFKCITVFKTNKNYYEVSATIYECIEKKSMIIGCNIWMICFELNCCFFYDPSPILKLSEFVKTLRSSVRVFFSNFLLIDATDKSSSNHHRIFFDVNIYPLSFVANTYLSLLSSTTSCYSIELVPVQ